MKIKKRADFPSCIRQYKELKGICVGECIDKSVIFKKGHIAHAHCYDGDAHQGWICVRCKYHLKIKMLMLHEVAHLIACKSLSTPPHGKKWREVLLKMGGTYKGYRYKDASGKIHETIDYTYRPRKI